MISYEPLKKTLKERNMNGVELEALIGKSFYYNITTGRYNLSTDFLALVCDALKCNVEDVCCYTSEKPKLITKHHIDWEYMRQCAAEKGITFYGISKQIKNDGKYLAKKFSQNSKMDSDELQSVADILGHKPEEFIVD